MDNKILHDPIDALLGVVAGNIVYKKIIFTIRPKFAISLLDENLSLKEISMLPNDVVKAIKRYCQVLKHKNLY